MNTFKGPLALISLLFSTNLYLHGSIIEEPMHEAQINQQRIQLQQEGLALYLEKSDAFDADLFLSTLNDSYNERMLSLMGKIVNIYDAGEKSSASVAVKKTWARNSLKNLVISAGLVTPDLTSKYENTEEDFKGGNVWRDLRFLYHFIQNDSNLISNNQVKKLIASQSLRKIIDQPKVETQNHLLDLYPFIAHQREQRVLKKAIECIDRARGLSFDQPHHQSAFLRAFAVLGEACTKKNLSPYTKKLHKIVPDWSQLIHIRDTIVHPESCDKDQEEMKTYGKTYEKLEYYFKKNSGSIPGQIRTLSSDLKKIRDILEETVKKLSSPAFENPKNRDNHYMGCKSTAPTSASSKTILSSLGPFHKALKRDRYETNYGALKSHHPATSLPLEVKLKREIDLLKDEVFNIHGKNALQDPFPEKNTNVSKDVLDRRAVLITSLIQEPARIDAAFHHLGRIEKFLSQDPKVEKTLQPITLKEYHAFRNFIQHGDDLVDSCGITPELLIRYTHILFYEMLPALKMSLQGVNDPEMP